MPFFGGLFLKAVDKLIDRNRASADARHQEAVQRDFAQQGVRWKVADAKAAGIHPLYALGAQTHSYTPVQVGGGSDGGGLYEMGQDISRAARAGQTQGERLAGPPPDPLLGERLRGLQLENQGRVYDNMLKWQEITSGGRLNAQIGPPFPSAGSAGNVSPARFPPTALNDPGTGAGQKPAMEKYNFGGLNLGLPTPDLAEVLESPVGVLAAKIAEGWGEHMTGSGRFMHPRFGYDLHGMSRPGYEQVWDKFAKRWEWRAIEPRVTGPRPKRVRPWTEGFLY